MKIMMLGAPGAGKGTIANLVSEKLNIPIIGTGDILRDEAKTNEYLQDIMSQGKLLPDEFVSEIVGKHLKKEEYRKGFILDGFPRTIKQAEFLDDNKISFDIVLDLEVSEEEVVKRLSTRRICEDCKAISSIADMSSEDEPCKKCGGKMIQRQDDTAESIKKRLKVYRDQTAPLIDYYNEKNILKEVDANPSIDKVFEYSMKVLD